MIDRNVEETLDLALMEIDRDDAIDPCSREHVRHELRRDGLAR